MTLFWRTFLLVAGLLGLGLTAVTAALVTLDEGTRAQRAGLQITSLVNLTRNALISSQAERRVELLAQLKRQEGAEVRLLEPADKVLDHQSQKFFNEALKRRLIELLGPNTRTAAIVNGEEAFWVSFNIDSDEYWLRIDPERLRPARGKFWIYAGLVVITALLSAFFISRYINRPLQNMAKALNDLSMGKAPTALSEDGPVELATLNRNFNRMARDMQQLESDRALALAGISHDVRTPLTRLRLELEVSKSLGAQEKESMISEIDRIDRIVGQFIEFARENHGESMQPTRDAPSIGEILQSTLSGFSQDVQSGRLVLDVQGDLSAKVRAPAVAMERVIHNCVSNALSYGSRESGGERRCHLYIGVKLDPAGKTLACQIADDGPGVPEDSLERLSRPFSRLDPERSAQGGAGLGLAIVERLVQRLGGHMRLSLNFSQRYRGLCVNLELPLMPSAGQYSA